MANEFVPEVHDIGKMVDNDSVIRNILATTGVSLLVKESAKKRIQEGKHVGGHTLDWLIWNPDDWHALHANPNFSIIDGHEDKKFNVLPQSAVEDIRLRKQILLTKIADHYGSTFSRAVAEKDEETEKKFSALRKIIVPERKRRVLWNEKARFASVAISNPDELHKLIRSLGEPEFNSQEFLTTWASKLECLPEDASVPRDATSLLTHLTLVGKIYRFLLPQYANAFQIDDILYLDKDQQVRSVEDAEGPREGQEGKPPKERKYAKWLMTLVTCRVKIPQHPVRVGDLNVFRKQEQVLEQIKNDHKDQVLFCTSDTLWLMLPSSNQVDVDKELSETMSPLFQHGFWAETRSLRDITLRPKQPEIQRLRWQKDQATRADQDIPETSVYSDKLAEAFDPPICSICQLRQATREWPREILIGYSNRNRLLFVAYVQRSENRVRLISARRADAQERRDYEEHSFD